MKCKTCGSKLIDGTTKCPYCGAIQTPSEKSESTFDWNVSDFPQQKKKAQIDIDWSAGKIFDRGSGQVYSQSDNVWSEPEDVKNLFTFDQKNEEYQELLDRQMDIITESEPPAEAPVRNSGNDFNLPSSMDMGLFSSLIEDDAEISIVTENGEVSRLTSSGDLIQEKNSKEPSNAAPEHLQENYRPEEPVIEEFKTNIFQHDKLGAELVYETPSPSKKPLYTPEDEDRVSKGLKKLMQAEEQFRSDMEQTSFITPEESVQADRLVEKSRKLTFVPSMEFRSIEDEYASYCDENGIEHKTYTPYTPPVRENTKKAPALMSNWRRRKAKEENKEVQIKINEPSGTRVTVKTQEISLARMNTELDQTTREVDLEELVNAPKNVQVSVEVSAGQGNASVEVTRRHDGATVVKTVGNSAQETLYVDEEQKDAPLAAEEIVQTAEEFEQPELVEAEVVETEAAQTEESEAADEEPAEIENESIEEEETPADSEAEQKFEPEADAMTEGAESEAESAAAATDAALEQVSDDGSEVNTAEAEATETIEPEAEGNTEEEAPAQEKADEGSFWERSDNATRMTITDIFGPEARKILNQIDKEQNAGSETEVDAAESVTDLSKSTILDINPEDISITPEQTAALFKPREINANVTEKESEAEVSQETEEASKSADEEDKKPSKSDEMVKSKAILKAEKAIEKEASRQKKRKEKAQKQLLKENAKKEKKNGAGDASVKKGMSKPAKVIVFILLILLICEFAIIGIKLYAGDSQAAVFIEKVEDKVISIFSGSDETEMPSDEAQNASNDEAKPADTAQDAAPPADGNAEAAAPADTAAPQNAA